MTKRDKKNKKRYMYDFCAFLSQGRGGGERIMFRDHLNNYIILYDIFFLGKGRRIAHHEFEDKRDKHLVVILCGKNNKN